MVDVSFYQKELKNILVFFCLLFFFILSLLFNASIIPIIFLLFCGFFYGIYSKNPILSSLLGILFPIILVTYLVHESAEIQRIFRYYIFLIFTGFFSGFFAGFTLKKFNNYYYNIFFFFISLIFLFTGAIYYISGIN